MKAPSEQRQIEILLKIQRLLEDGDFTATYKFALLQALIDVAVETGCDDDGELEVSTHSLAEKFIESYWPQVRPFARTQSLDAHAVPFAVVAEGGEFYAGTVLRQGTQKADAIPRAVQDLARESGHSLARARSRGIAWRRVVTRVRGTVCVMPLWHLQLARDDFLYPQPARQGVVESIRLRSGVTFTLRRFQHLLREMVRGAWVGYVRCLRANKPILGEAEDLHEFLFGQPRRTLEACRDPLLAWQDGLCLYCRRGLRLDAVHVDHFIPWVRYPSNLAHNLVASHLTCNNQKSSHLAALPHLETWYERVHAPPPPALSEKGAMADLSATMNISRWAYSQVADAGASVRQHAHGLVPLGARWRDVLRPSHPR